MGFANRALDACVRAMEEGSVSDRHMRDVLRCRQVNVQPIALYLRSRHPIVRKMAAQILGERGSDIGCVIDAALKEEEKDVLVAMLSVIGKRGGGLEALDRLLGNRDGLIREEVISMFRRAGRAELLFPLLFDEDDAVVKRIKQYMYEQERHTEKSGT